MNVMMDGLVIKVVLQSLFSTSKVTCLGLSKNYNVHLTMLKLIMNLIWSVAIGLRDYLLELIFLMCASL